MFKKCLYYKNKEIQFQNIYIITFLLFCETIAFSCWAHKFVKNCTNLQTVFVEIVTNIALNIYAKHKKTLSVNKNLGTV